MRINKKKKEIFNKIQDNIEQMIWVGCNPDNPELFKKQASEGFKLMAENSKLWREYYENHY